MKYLFLLLLWLPFVLLTDLFPLMRFGMFAEPVKTEQQTEFFILILKSGKSESILSAKETGINTQTFNYLARNYHYKHKENTLLKTIAATSKIKSKQSLILKKITVKSPLNQVDTTLIYAYNQP